MNGKPNGRDKKPPKKNGAARSKSPSNAKDASLEAFRDAPEGAFLTTDQGVRVQHTDNSLKAGERGPTLMEDFHFREKMTHFDHERIPERVVHARGSGAHGVFQVYKSMRKYTKAAFLQDPSLLTPVFVRFSTVVGSRGSADTARDVRGFATKFYTQEGNYDLVGNNIPVFFIQDGIKFPDLIHAVKPEPGSEMPQAASAHDTFWDFVSLVPETAHMVMWVMSDRALPRSFAMMEGFGVHTFRLVNEQGDASLVKFHWKPLLGVHSLLWDEAQMISGKDADFHRRDLWEAIEAGNFPEYELGVQIVPEEDVLRHGFDMLDATKLLPEEIVPVQRIGKMTLNRNPDNFFAETEQVAFHTGNVVPGVDFTNDPLLQARLFSYVDTQLTRLGGPNFAEIPINRPVVPVANHQQDGHMRTTVNTGKANYHPNSVGGGSPLLASAAQGGYVHDAEKVEGHKIRARSDSFKDHFGQATMFFQSLSEFEQRHLIAALRFELGKVERKEIRQRVVGLLANIDQGLAGAVSEKIGVPVPRREGPRPKAGRFQPSPALSMANTVMTAKGRCVAVLAASGVNGAEIAEVKKALEGAGAKVHIVSHALGELDSSKGSGVEATKTFLTVASVLYDAVYIPGGKASVDALIAKGEAIHFVNEAYRHCKPIGASSEGVMLLAESDASEVTLADAHSNGKLVADHGVVTVRAGSSLKAFVAGFMTAIAGHRYWEREASDAPAE